MRSSRALTPTEVTQLERRGNIATDWDLVRVTEKGFSALNIRNTYFRGRAYLGADLEIVGATISGYEILDNTAVINSTLEAEGNQIHVLNEAGNRIIYCTPGLTPQIAYMEAFHTYKSGLQEGFKKLQTEEDLCTIEKNVVIKTGCTIRNTYVGHHTVLEGFTADNCFIADNCHLSNGEGVSAFCGPMTVSHHKSTLLIAGLYSFYNAGSNTNSSNHNYRLGPIHQAIYNRGVKTGSGSYVLQPAHIGDFSMVVGKHYNHPNTSKLPFSYIVEKEGVSVIFPAQNFKAIGMWRDLAKWPSRYKLANDAIVPDFSIHRPTYINKLFQAASILEQLLENAKGDVVTYEGCRIQKIMLQPAIDTYKSMAQALLMARYAMKRKECNAFIGVEGDCENWKWIDLCGSWFNKRVIDTVEKNIADGKYHNLDKITDELFFLQQTKQHNIVKAIVSMMHTYLNIDDLSDTEKVDVEIAKAKKTFEQLLDILLFDAKRESNGRMTVGYGLDGDENDCQADFDFVHSSLDEDTEAAVKVIRTYIETLS
ncbi:MAG: DUF4954 family protein [Bacteroidales bacterium]|nr:DUF4954 family protein [Bacteroidales bacterium]